MKSPQQPGFTDCNTTNKNIMKTTLIQLTTVLLTLPLATAKEPRGPGGHRPPPVIAVLDADGDGTLSTEEISNAGLALLTLDKNGDGALTPEELHPEGRPPRKGGRPPKGGDPSDADGAQ